MKFILSERVVFDPSGLNSKESLIRAATESLDDAQNSIPGQRDLAGA